YVVDSIDILTRLYGIKEERYQKSIQDGVKFYYEEQFNEKGYCYWRIPTVWPVDIHNQSQGIISFTRFADQDDRFQPFAQRIYDWTVKNMRSSKGRFYYQKYSFFTNKTNYLRWGQAWMLLAMTTLYTQKN
ncbi:MAG: hypothetical protein AAFO69_07435, partial [Bacteroidota bacterium]